MWKKDETPRRPSPHSSARPDPAPTERTPRAPVAEPAVIGRKIKLKGEITGEEDLIIEGRVDGSVELRSHSVTVGQEGNVKASISGRTIKVKGKVQGNLAAEEQIVLLSSATVEGDLVAPRVIMEDGASFRGGIEMGDAVTRPKSGGARKPLGPRTKETQHRREAASSGSATPPAD